MSRLACLLACVPLAVSALDAPQPKWHGDLDEAYRLARKTNQPLFVVFRCEH
jgi:hypothetical protein